MLLFILEVCPSKILYLLSFISHILILPYYFKGVGSIYKVDVWNFFNFYFKGEEEEENRCFILFSAENFYWAQPCLEKAEGNY